MSAKTRINRPTYATPRKLYRERMVHQSTLLERINLPNGLKKVLNLLPIGKRTYRK